jgi:hypothetical protein
MRDIMNVKLHRKTMIFNTTDGAYSVMEVRRGYLIMAVAVRVSEVFNNMTSITIGDDTTADGYGTVTIGSTQLENLTGAYLCTQYTGDGATTNCWHLYTDTNIAALGTSPAIKATYTASDTPTTGVMTIYIVYAEGVE